MEFDRPGSGSRDQVGLIGRFGAIDPTDGGHTYRYSASLDWQHGSGHALTKITAYGSGTTSISSSNFTYDLDDPVHGDQIEQADHRFVTGGKLVHRRIGRWAGHDVQNIVGIQVRNDDITNVALYHTEARVRLETRTQDAVVETAGGVFGQNEIGMDTVVAHTYRPSRGRVAVSGR